MSQQGLQGLARILLLIGAVVTLVGGFVSAGPVLALVVGIVSLVYYGDLAQKVSWWSCSCWASY